MSAREEAASRVPPVSKERRERRFWPGVAGPLWVVIRWPLIAVLAGVSVYLGYLGFDSYLAVRGVMRSFWDKLYLSFQLFLLESGNLAPPIPTPLGIARILAPALTFYTAISAILTVFREQLARGRIRLRANDHVVVCGVGRTGLLLALNFSEQHRVVAVEKHEQSPGLATCRERGIWVLPGDASDRGALSRARVDRARFLFAVCGEDGVNAKMAVDAHELVEGRTGTPLTCFVQILDADLAALLATEMAAHATAGFRLEFFNASEVGAPALLDQHPPFAADPAAAPPHLLVAGLGEMGSRIVLHAARRWPAGPDHLRFRVTVVDRSAERLVGLLLLRHPEIADVCDVIPESTDIDTAAFERGDFLEGGAPPPTRIYVCLDDDARGIGAALRLRHAFPDRRVKIVVRTKQRGGVGALLSERAAREDLRVFELLEHVCRPDVLTGRTEVLARAIHEDYVRKEREKGMTVDRNPSMATWETLSEDKRESNRRQADDIVHKLTAIGCEIAGAIGNQDARFAFAEVEVERLAEMEHDRWLRERLEGGWRWAWGPKDDQARTHPSLVPWSRLTREELIARYGAEWAARLGDSELTEEEREKDRDAVRGILERLARGGLRVVPLREEARHGPSK